MFLSKHSLHTHKHARIHTRISSIMSEMRCDVMLCSPFSHIFNCIQCLGSKFSCKMLSCMYTMYKQESRSATSKHHFAFVRVCWTWFQVHTKHTSIQKQGNHFNCVCFSLLVHFQQKSLLINFLPLLWNVTKFMKNCLTFLEILVRKKYQSSTFFVYTKRT